MNNSIGERPMYDVTCSNCGTETQVPFQPSGDRPVYCRDCFQKQRGNRGGGGGGGYGGGHRQMYDAVCANCQKNTQVPFQPRGDKPVYCLDCFKKQRG